MSAPKLTPWFPGHIKPVRPGVYQTDSDGYPEPLFQHWNGRFWGCAYTSVDNAAVNNSWRSMFQNDAWRGLAEEPK